MELQAGDLQNSMADYSTTARGIPIRFAGGYWARRQLHAGIRYVPTLSIPMELVSALNGVPGGGIAGTWKHVYKLVLVDRIEDYLRGL